MAWILFKKRDESVIKQNIKEELNISEKDVHNIKLIYNYLSNLDELKFYYYKEKYQLSIMRTKSDIYNMYILSLVIFDKSARNSNNINTKNHLFVDFIFSKNNFKIQFIKLLFDKKNEITESIKFIKNEIKILDQEINENKFFQNIILELL